MDRLANIVKGFLGRNRSASGRRLQEQLDVFRLSLLVERRALSRGGGGDLDEAAVASIRGRSLETQRESLHARVHEQTMEALAALDEEWTGVGTPERRRLARVEKEARGIGGGEGCAGGGTIGESGNDAGSGADGSSGSDGVHADGGANNGSGSNAGGRSSSSSSSNPSSPASSPASPSNPDNWNFASAAQSDARSVVSDRERAAAVADGVRDALGFSLHVAGSAIPGAGRGLFVRGSAPAGTMVCLYPGVVYLPLDLSNVKTQEEVDATFGEGNGNLLSRFDGTVIDASEYMVPGDARPVLENPFATGQFINHATADGAANVLSCSYNFPSDEALPEGFPTNLRSYMPNRYAVPPGLVSLLQTNGAIGMSVAFVTTRDIEDEEILANYRLNPNLGLPDWYTPVDEDEDARRWG